MKCFSLLQYKGALFVLYSCLLFSIYYYLSSEVPATYSIHEYEVGEHISFYSQYLLQLLAPLFGWVADAWLGRYTLFLCSIVAGVLGCIVQSISIAMINEKVILSSPVQYIADIIENFSIAAFLVYSLPFITDQMIGASGDELSSAVDWFFWCNGTAYLFSRCILYLITKTISIPLSVWIYCMSIAFVIAGLILFKHNLMIHQQTINPFTLVAKVLNYARKNKYPKNRSALTYWENDFPSRIDLGKEKYGGPFSEENIEDVKTFLRLIPLIMTIELGALFDDNFSVPPLYQHMKVNKNIHGSGVFNNEDLYFSAIIITLVPVWHFILKPLFPNFGVQFTMLKLAVTGLGLYAIGSLGFLTIDLAGQIITPNATCIFSSNVTHNSSSADPVIVMDLNYFWTIIPVVISQAGCVFIEIGFKKFIIAQSPHQMKGMLFACVFGFNAIYHVIGSFIHIPYHRLSHTPPGCGFYFYLTQTLFFIVLLILFSYLSYGYKLRQRNNPVNIHLIVGDHVDKYITQREELLTTATESYGATT